MRLILLDLDDTLLHSDKTVSPYTARVLRACQEKGLLVAFATARGETNIRPFVEQVKPDVVIASGGALIRRGGEIIDARLFSGEETAAMLSAALRLNGPDCLITVDTPDTYYGNYLGDASETLQGWGEVRWVDFTAFREPSLKICLHLPDDDMARAVAEASPGCDWLRFSGSQWYKFTKPDINKAAAARRLSALMNIPREEMAAFGDDTSDIGMLRWCGTGVAVANAIPEVKAVADVIVASQDEDGPAAYLEKTYLRGD